MRHVASSNAYQALAEFRYLIRSYLNHSAKAAESVGLEPQQYVALLQLRGMPEGEEPTIRSLADRLQVRHNTATELINRMEKRGLLRRERSNADRRRVLLRTTTRGERLLGRLVRHRIAELRTTAPDLVKSLRDVLSARATGQRDHRRGAAEEAAPR
jgi:DNA-binding MarR family transcriptional regulator